MAGECFGSSGFGVERSFGDSGSGLWGARLMLSRRCVGHSLVLGRVELIGSVSLESGFRWTPGTALGVPWAPLDLVLTLDALRRIGVTVLRRDRGAVEFSLFLAPRVSLLTDGHHAPLIEGRIPSVIRQTIDPLTHHTTTPFGQTPNPPRQSFNPPRDRRREAPGTQGRRRRLGCHGPLELLDHGPHGTACAAGCFI